MKTSRTRRKKVQIGKANFVDIVMVGAAAKHTIWLNGKAVGYLHAFCSPEKEIHYLLSDLDMQPLGGRFTERDEVREWVRNEM